MWSRWSDIDRMFNTMNLLQARMDRMFGDDYDVARPVPAAWIAAEGMPKTNLYDVGDHFEVILEVPGFTKDDLDIKIQGNYLEISGTHKPDVHEGYSAHRVERGGASFNRSFTLPSDVDADKTGASLKNGLLILSLPKSEAAKPKQITVK
jgi:HSP20 family protein